MTLRKKYINSSLINKTCKDCRKTYPRDDQHFYTTTTSKIGIYNYRPECITCGLKRSQLHKKKNKARKKETDIKYSESENGFFRELWHGIVRSKHGNDFKNYEEFFECWTEQKKVYGTKCPFYGFEMTRIKGLNIGKTRRKATDTNISKDRILSSNPYSKKNIMFISWKANSEKCNISPKTAKRYLEIVKERYGTDEMERICL